jgi:hypothetical protein
MAYLAAFAHLTTTICDRTCAEIHSHHSRLRIKRFRRQQLQGNSIGLNLLFGDQICVFAMQHGCCQSVTFDARMAASPWRVLILAGVPR